MSITSTAATTTHAATYGLRALAATARSHPLRATPASASYAPSVSVHQNVTPEGDTQLARCQLITVQEATMPGPVPNRSDQRVRRNKPEVPITKVTAIGNVPIPELDLGETTHPLVTSMYESLRHSAQAKFYEPSDWEYARLTFHFVNELLWRREPSAMMLASVNQMLTSLLMTEGDRRRVRLEVERTQTDTGTGKVMSVADRFKQQLGVAN